MDSDGDDVCDWIELEAIMNALSAGLYCGDGTLWVESEQTCMSLEGCLGDLNNDAIRGTEDLLMLLTVYGQDCE